MVNYACFNRSSARLWDFPRCTNDDHRGEQHANAIAYLAGPMRGIPFWNFPAFQDAAVLLRRKGWHIWSPADHDLDLGLVPVEDGNVSFPISACLDWDFARIAESSCVIVLPGWEQSTGVHWEMTVAYALGKPVFQYPTLEPVELPEVVTQPVAVQRAHVPQAVWDARMAAWHQEAAPSLGPITPQEADAMRASATGREAQTREVSREDIAASLAAVAGRMGEIRVVDPNAMRTFDTGATRHIDETKLDYEGFLSPAALRLYAEYLQKNRIQADGNVRDSDNWQKGIPLNVYMKSAWRHFIAAWTAHRSGGDPAEDLCGLLFNAMGYLHEWDKRDSA